MPDNLENLMYFQSCTQNTRLARSLGMLRSLSINICKHLQHQILGRITWAITWHTSAPIEIGELKRISQRNKSLLSYLVLVLSFFVCFFLRNHYFYFGCQLQWKYSPCSTVSNPLEDFSGPISTETFFASVALSLKNVATEKKLYHHCFYTDA